MSSSPTPPTTITNNNNSPQQQQIPRHSERRTRPRLTDQIQIIRELWLLREQARVQAAERCFLTELERLLSGGPYSRNVNTNPPPPFSTTTTTTTSTTTTTTTLAPEPPPLPSFPLPPQSPFSSSITPQTVSPVPLFVNDGFVFESNPPPRSDHVVREMPGSVSQEMEQARASQRVTNLSAEFRARLEGQEDTLSHQLQQQQQNEMNNGNTEELSHQRAVSSVLDSQFRHRLERVLHQRRTNSYQMRHLYRTGSYDVNENENENTTGRDGNNITRNNESGENNNNIGNNDNDNEGRRGALESIVTALREEVNVLRNVVNASFDIQLDIQRSIRQEVAAAMSTPATLSLNNNLKDNSNNKNTSSPMVEDITSTCSNIGSSSTSSSSHLNNNNNNNNPSALLLNNSNISLMKAGLCTVCLEENIDALLYACGHMCTCSSCGRQLLAGGLACPICRAPVRDVVRAFVVTE